MEEKEVAKEKSKTEGKKLLQNLLENNNILRLKNQN